MVSGNPPRFDIITAQPLLAASKLVLPKGSSHLEHATEILVFLNISKTFLWFWKPIFFSFLCLKINFSLGSSPITIARQFSNWFNIFMIAFPNKSYPFAEFNFPTNVIIFSFLKKLTFSLLMDWWITSSLFDLW